MVAERVRPGTRTSWTIAAVVVAAVGVIYRESTQSYFFNDDFHWLAQTQEFDPANLFRLERYDHFYRPVIELYFYAGLQLFGCEARPFHLTSVGIHLLTTLILFLFARTLTGCLPFALLTALFFSVQPGYVEAVTWVGAITDLLPVLWYLLALWMHLLFLQRGRAPYYVGALAAFTTCLLTHESSATLLPMMVLLEVTVGATGGLRARIGAVARHIGRYAPFIVLLAGYLVLAYIVNSRSYLVREGYYALGWHAVPNILNYIVGLYVGKRMAASYVAIGAVFLVLLWRGTPMVRLYVLWILVSLGPVAFFTWGTASRYLYLPAAGFALLLAAAIMQLRVFADRWLPPRMAWGVTMVVVAVLAVRFGVFAKKGADSFRERTLPYERFVAAITASQGVGLTEGVVYATPASLENVPELYRDAAARIAFCRPNVRVVVR